MILELDHIFCFCTPALSEAKLLEDHGFHLTHGKIHHGQGTANRSLVFISNYLELIYLKSDTEAKTNPLKLHNRANWKMTGASPFGIALRGEIPEKMQNQFWDYHPPYNPSVVIKVHRFNEDHPDFPFLFVMPGLAASLEKKVQFKDFVNHRSGTETIIQVLVGTTSEASVLNGVIEGLSFEKNSSHRLEILIDGEIPHELQLNELLTLRSPIQN